jgi:hypothetical protein
VLAAGAGEVKIAAHRSPEAAGAAGLHRGDAGDARSEQVDETLDAGGVAARGFTFHERAKKRHEGIVARLGRGEQFERGYAHRLLS